ncbi:MAG: hypothetical protein LBK60_05165 [Verrucomicrobiales bacterium]|nr:hypothetical protein [Verrucomicrobiales bacterium]
MAEIRISLPRWPYGLLGVSLALHAGLLLMVSGWVIGWQTDAPGIPEAFAEPPAFVQDEWEAPPPEPPEDMAPEPAADTASAAALPTLMMGDGGASGGNEYSSFVAAMPAAIGVAGNLLPESRAGGGAGAADGGGRVGKSLQGKITVGNIFNTRVESARLGVLLDVSSSAHPYLPLTVREIERHFGDAVIVLTYGCGMYERAGADGMYVREFGRCKPADAGAKNTLGQIAKAGGATGDLFKKFRARPGTYVLYAENCGHTYFGFKKLLDEKVDTVYWFADFRDKISNRVAGQLIKELQARGIKVIAHNFTGKPVPEEGEKIAQATGGSTIAKVPR